MYLQSLDILLDQLPDFLLTAFTRDTLLLSCPKRSAALQSCLVLATLAIEAEQLQLYGWVALDLRLRTARFGVQH